ncbi:MAG: hypothetical protein H6722_01775 [Sandaracinus sp.]|nr:hypothetical protein [Sandaracinus sp.]
MRKAARVLMATHGIGRVSAKRRCRKSATTETSAGARYASPATPHIAATYAAACAKLPWSMPCSAAVVAPSS